jgi:hypothetical protein
MSAEIPNLFSRAAGYVQQGRLTDAIVDYDRILVLNPDNADAHYNRGTVLYRLGRHDEALANYDHAVALKPDHVVAHNNRGSTLCKLGRYDEALSSYDRAIALNPRHAKTLQNRALVHLLFGDYAKGLEAYELRRRGEIVHRPGGATINKPPRSTHPQWRGEDLAGKTILLHVEQGLGDSLQMLRYLPWVKEKAAHVILESPRELWPVLGPLADGLTLVPIYASPPRVDWQCPWLSLPLAFATRLNTIPAQVPYLTAPRERMAAWRARLPHSAKRRVGLVWSGSPRNENDRERSIAIERLAPVLAVPGISFVSLQKEYRTQDLTALSDLPIERIDEALADFGETAAAIEQCDVVISVDTSVAHLAGSLAKPVWLLLPRAPDWRWLLDRADSPWYPTARLFRQPRIGDWDSVIATVARALSMLPPTVDHSQGQSPAGGPLR